MPVVQAAMGNENRRAVVALVEKNAGKKLLNVVICCSDCTDLRKNVR